MNDDGFLTAEEARNKFADKHDFKALLGRIRDKIEHRVDEGLRYAHFEFQDSEENSLYYNSVVEFLENKGYKTFWNNSCCWLEISW